MSSWKENVKIAAGITFGVAVTVGLVVALAVHEDVEAKRDVARAAEEQRLEWEGPCKDMSWLLATTAGSPSAATCPNKLHWMHVQVASQSSSEEGTAVVFCACEREHAEQSP